MIIHSEQKSLVQNAILHECSVMPYTIHTEVTEAGASYWCAMQRAGSNCC